jgi:hypothetical protein
MICVAVRSLLTFVLYVRFQVLTAASMKFRVFWDVAPYAPLKRRSTSMRLHGATSQKILNFCYLDPPGEVVDSSLKHVIVVHVMGETVPLNCGHHWTHCSYPG